MPATPRSIPARGDAASREAVRAAFNELHGPRLHGFALLLSLGDRPLAAGLTAQALASAAAHIDELRHPERAAAWLRGRVLRSSPRRHREPSPAEERAALEPLDVDPAVIDGLAALGARARAALVAADVERLDRRDVAAIVGRSGAALENLLRRARHTYLGAWAAAPTPVDGTPGPLVRRIQRLAARTMA